MNRADNSPEQTGNSVQLHTLFLEEQPTQYPEFTNVAPLLNSKNFRCEKDDAGGEWNKVQPFQIAIHALEVQRQTRSQPEAHALRPLSRQEIVNLSDTLLEAAPSPAAAAMLVGNPLFSYRYSQLKARVTIGDDTPYSKRFNVDIDGGDTLTFAGENVNVEILYPTPGRIIQPGQDLNTVAGLGTPGLVLDTIVQASASPQLAYAGHRRAHISVTRIGAVAPAQPMAFKIPPGGCDVTISSDFAFPALSIVGTFNAGLLPSTGPEVVGAITAEIASTSRVAIPGTARWVVVQANNVGERITCTFGLEY